MYYPDNRDFLEKSNVKAVIYSYGVKLESGVENIRIENVQFDKFAEIGIHATGSNAGITIQNCSFENIGKMGVKMGRKSNDILIRENNFRNVLGRGISLTECWNAKISGNVVKKTGLIPGQGTSGTNSYIGIVAELRDESYDRKYDRFDSIANHITISHNFIDSSGYIGLRIDGQYNLAEKNIIDHSMLQLDDGGGLYCFNEFTGNSVISNNFIYRSSTQGSISNGIYIDNLVYNMDVSENTVVSNAGSGILVNAAARDNLVSKNVLYGNGNGVCFSDWKETPVTGNKVTNNVIVSLKTTDPAVLLFSNYYRYNMAVYDSNYYVNPFTANLFKFDWSVKKFIGFEQWKSEFKANDKNSKAVVNFANGTQNKTVLFTNKSDTLREINLKDYTFYDLDFNPVNQLVLEPYLSAVLISPDFTDGILFTADPPVIVPVNKFLPVNYDRNCFAGSDVFPQQGGNTGLGELKSFDSSLKVYPNPVVAGHILNIADADFSNGYELYSLYGNKINTNKNFLSDRIQLHIPQIPVGAYVVLNEKSRYSGVALVQVIQ
jgi:parallel beta-helix repeat protein